MRSITQPNLNMSLKGSVPNASCSPHQVLLALPFTAATSIETTSISPPQVSTSILQVQPNIFLFGAPLVSSPWASLAMLALTNEIRHSI